MTAGFSKTDCAKIRIYLKETAMYKNINEAKEASKRLQLRYGMECNAADKMVLAFAEVSDFEALTDGLPTPQRTALQLVELPSSFQDYLRNNENPFLINGYRYTLHPASIANFLLPKIYHNSKEKTAPKLLAYAREVLAEISNKPSWLQVNDVRKQPDGEINVEFASRHRDGIRLAPAIYTVYPEEFDGDKRLAIDSAINDYVSDKASDQGPDPFTNEKVSAGAADHLYGVDEVTLRWARDQNTDDLRAFLRSIIMEQYGDQMGYSDADGTPSLPRPEEQMAEKSIKDSKYNGYVAHLSRNIVRRIMNIHESAVWDCGLHLAVNLPQTAKAGIDDIDIIKLVDHPYFEGLKAKRTIETRGSFREPGNMVIETTARCISLDSCHLPEASWQDVSIIASHEITEGPVIESFLEIMDEEVISPVTDHAYVDGAYYALVCEPSGENTIYIVGPSGKVYTEDSGPFASSCPRRFIDKVSVDEDGASQWRLRCLGLSDRVDAYSYIV